MVHVIIDRRPSKKKSSPNRQKFLKRSRAVIKDQVKNIVRDTDIADISKKKKEKIKIPSRDITEPYFHHDPQSGKKERVLPGNDRFEPGDRFRKPRGGDGGGRQGSNSGEGEDDFEFQISQEEFLEYFFEDLELPDLAQTNFTSTTEMVSKRSGFSNQGNPSRLDLLRSMKGAAGRRIALKAPKTQEIRELEELILTLKEDEEKHKAEIIEAEEKLAALKRKKRVVPYIDDTDLQYRQWTQHPVPITRAVMFCVMDVSGSMQAHEKDLAKRFFILLHLFLTRNYEKIDVVFIRHHTEAKVVDEEEFFYSRETGGTIVSSALELTAEVIKKKYPPNEWNAYVCQASDGDNWQDDNTIVEDLLTKSILPLIRYYFYIEVGEEGGRRRESDLWGLYDSISSASANMAIAQVNTPGEIYPVFRGLFEKRV